MLSVVDRCHLDPLGIRCFLRVPWQEAFKGAFLKDNVPFNNQNDSTVPSLSWRAAHFNTALGRMVFATVEFIAKLGSVGRVQNSGDHLNQLRRYSVLLDICPAKLEDDYFHSVARPSALRECLVWSSLTRSPNRARIRYVRTFQYHTRRCRDPKRNREDTKC